MGDQKIKNKAYFILDHNNTKFEKALRNAILSYIARSYGLQISVSF